MEGILLVDKPISWTSFDVVNYVRKIVASGENKKPKNVKVGHSGTLDPFASGLLVLLIGKNYTKRANELIKLDKTYEFTIHLGKTSSTGDPEGDITDYSSINPSMEQIQEVISHYIGKIQQIPPSYSAIKVSGQRSYKLASKGIKVEHQAREIVINSLKIIKYNYPLLKLIADVSSGTYIRTLAEDIGKELKSGAYTTQLRRLSIDKYKVSSALKVSEIDKDTIEQNIETLT